MKADSLIREGDEAMERGDWKTAIICFERAAMIESPSEELLSNLRECRNMASLVFSRSLSGKYADSFTVQIAEINELDKAGRKDLAIQRCTELLCVFQNNREYQQKLRWRRLSCVVGSGKYVKYIEEDFKSLWEALNYTNNTKAVNIFLSYISAISCEKAVPYLENILKIAADDRKLKELLESKISELKVLLKYSSSPRS